LKFRSPNVSVFVPDGVSDEEAIQRATHIAVGAHQDDLEIMAFHGILHCFASRADWFLGITVTDGAGSPRVDHYADYTDEQMKEVRKREQDKAAVVGEYSAMVQLGYSSGATKSAEPPDVVADLKEMIRLARPRVIYTHNLADKHDTHVAVALRLIRALRELPPECHPEEFYGSEVWRNLDWVADEDKIALDVAPHENLASALLGLFDSQISGGKRYDLATMGRRRANATYYASHGVDETTALCFAMDLMPLIEDPALTPDAHAQQHIRTFAAEVSNRIAKLEAPTAPSAPPEPHRRPWKKPLVRTKHR
jgi:LmbE family N-acetylglucosaminyl deacetylase